ncbi:hypothetical protein GCM10023205_10570 [Yinghuangia aomiensis]|uniref:Uncharacterized protein n=1 Tax=Yinghuangia aomiensis TaxID=676205 RepID=A0ABP9GSM1_9ACTN
MVARAGADLLGGFGEAAFRGLGKVDFELNQRNPHADHHFPSNVPPSNPRAARRMAVRFARTRSARPLRSVTCLPGPRSGRADAASTQAEVTREQ